MIYILILVVILIIFILAYSFYNKKQPNELLIKGCYRKKQYLSKTEREFFFEMRKSIDSKYMIGFQTRVIDLFNMPKGLKKQNYSKYMKIFSKFNRKTVDFIILNDSFKILCAIELDDKSHNYKNRIKRDYEINQLFAYIKMPLVRYKVSSAYNFDSLNNILDNLNSIEKN
tara:strand:- start:21 stop:533 length:513 start_codon:yes stop_codon:yes gene_type:complete